MDKFLKRDAAVPDFDLITYYYSVHDTRYDNNSTRIDFYRNPMLLYFEGILITLFLRALIMNNLNKVFSSQFFLNDLCSAAHIYIYVYG